MAVVSTFHTSLPDRYNEGNRLVLVKDLNLRVGMYVVVESNALRVNKLDEHADLGGSLWVGNIEKTEVQTGEYLIPVVERYKPEFHKDALRVIELTPRPTLVTHTHCGSEKSVVRTSLERIARKEINYNIESAMVWGTSYS